MYTARIDSQPARITLLDASGSAVWATRGGDDAGSGSAGQPPLGFAAIGTTSVDIEMQYGSFKFTEDKSSETWTSVDHLGSVKLADGGATFDMIAGSAVVGAGLVDFRPDASGHMEIVLTAASTRISLGAPCPTDEHIAGLGGQSWDVDHRGQTVPLWVQEDGIGKGSDADDDYSASIWFETGRRHSTHTPMPMLLSSKGYALSVDTNARAIFALGSEGADVARYEVWDKALDLHVFAGAPADPKVALGKMIGWVGRAPVPPAVVFAPWVDAIFGSANVRAIAQELRDNGVSSSVIWTEDWRGGADTGTGYALEENWNVDRTLYPDIEQLASDLHAQGFQFLTYFNTFLDATADVYTEALAGGYEIRDGSGGEYVFPGVSFGSSTLLDLTNGSAVAWANGILGSGAAEGADGWMADFGEWEPTDAVLASGEDALTVHNRYPVDWAQLNRALLGNDKPFFMRSAWLHSQPLVSVIWPGDQQTDWSAGDGLPSVIPMAIGLGVTGFPLFGGDIGGYMSQGTVPTTEELWYRWASFGALQPVMRTHHGRSARENFHWDHDAASIAHFRRWTRLHMQLAAYLSGSMGSYTTRGLPLMRLVALDYPSEDWAWTATDEYLLGDRILVAPVQVEGATGRDLMLPAGSWVPLLGGPAVAGGAVHADAAMTEIPAFVPSGSMLVLYPDGVDTVNAVGSGSAVTLASVGGDREVWLYPGSGGGGAVWNDTTGAEGSAQWTWTSAGSAAPTSATFGGAAVTVTAGSGSISVDVVGDGTLAFSDGSKLVIARGDATARVHVIVYTQ
jgi:alpha-glucosidase